MKKWVLLNIVGSVLLGCNHDNYSTLILSHDKTVSQYNDTTFNSRGYISPYSGGYVISDDINKFIAIADQDVNNLEIIGRVGKAQGEYPYIPKLFRQVGNFLYFCMERKLYMYDLQGKISSQIDISSFSKSIKNDLIFHKGYQLIFPLQGQEYNFASYDTNDGKIKYFHKNSILNKLFEADAYTALLDYDIFVVVEYNNQNKTGLMHAFSLSDDDIYHVTEIPLNRGMTDILEMVPQAPAFDGICGWKNRIFIAYNSTGLVTTEFDTLAQNDDWIFLDYPDEEEKDRVILFNFYVTEKNIIFFNQGLLRFYKNPFKL